jgi:alpha-ketoglutarate-dependent taurine dioxygenase
VIQCSRRFFTGFGALPRSPDILPITEAQAEALDALHFLADSFHILLDFKKGDVQYINNLSILHSRKGFIDDAEHK